MTGVSTGIGYEIAKALVVAGFHVFGSVRKQRDAASVALDFGSAFTPLVFDVTDEEGIAKAASKVRLRSKLPCKMPDRITCDSFPDPPRDIPHCLAQFYSYTQSRYQNAGSSIRFNFQTKSISSPGASSIGGKDSGWPGEQCWHCKPRLPGAPANRGVQEGHPSEPGRHPCSHTGVLLLIAGQMHLVAFGSSPISSTTKAGRRQPFLLRWRLHCLLSLAFPLCLRTKLCSRAGGGLYEY